MLRITADWIFSVSSPPLKNGMVVAHDDGTIAAVLPEKDGVGDARHLEGIVCPGFVNAHCHLELSHLKGRIPENTGLVEFIRQINLLRGKLTAEEKEERMTAEDDGMYHEGIVAVGDVSNTGSSFSVKAQSRLYYHTFIEALGFQPERAEMAFTTCKDLQEQLFRTYPCSNRYGCSIVPHAPYSISMPLFKKIAHEAIARGTPLSVHNGESEEENLMYLEGRGRMLEFYEEFFNFDCSGWKATGTSALKAVLPLLPEDHPLLLVHNTYTEKEEILWAERLHRKLYWCFCPNANLYIENRLPDIVAFREAGVRMVLGTDSLASNRQLSILEEMKVISLHYPHIPTGQLITWATRNGAEFLGLDTELGTLETGKKPGVVWIKGASDLRIHENAVAERIV